MVRFYYVPTWIWVARFERKARGDAQYRMLMFGLSGGSDLQVAEELSGGEKGNLQQPINVSG